MFSYMGSQCCIPLSLCPSIGILCAGVGVPVTPGQQICRILVGVILLRFACNSHKSIQFVWREFKTNARFVLVVGTLKYVLDTDAPLSGIK